MLKLAAIAALIVGLAAPAAAQRPQRKVTVGAVDSLGPAIESKLIAVVERELAARDDLALIGRKRVTRLLRRARRVQLQSCEGDIGCLTEMGRTVGADWVVSLELSGLGDVRLLHFKLIDTARGRTIRATTARLTDDGLEPGAVVRLVSPAGYRGRLALDINADDAQVFVDGQRMAVAPVSTPLNLRVGTHALRITHPEYRDYVRFVDIDYAGQHELAVDMKPLGIVSSEVTATGRPTSGPRRDSPAPWYGRWYVIAGVGAAVLGGSIAIWAATSDGLDFDRQRP